MEPPRRAWFWAAGLAVLIAIAGVVFLGLRGAFVPPRPPAAGPPAPGPYRPAPDFRLRAFDGDRIVGLSDFRGTVVVLNFWASWCTPCKQEMPNLERAWQEFRARGVVVLGINVLDGRSEAAAFLRAFRITYPNVHDPEQARMVAYQVTALPTTVFIDRERRIRARFVGGYVGAAGYAQLRAEILALLDGR